MRRTRGRHSHPKESKGRLGRALQLVAVGAIVSLLSAGIASADEVHNDVAASADGKIVTITAGQSASVDFWITQEPFNQDGQDRCNAADGSSALLSMNAPSGVTATPTSLTFTTCSGTAKQSVSFSSSTPGTYSISPTVSDSGPGTYATTHATFTLKVNAAPVTNTPPSLSLPANMTVEGNTTGGANVSYSASASDNEDGPLTPMCSPASGSFFALGGPHTVNCSVTDSGGLSDSGSFTVTVVDTTAPTLLGMPSDKSATATSASGAIVTYTNPTASDIVDPNPSVSCSPASGSTFLGATTVTCTAKDASNNEATASFKVTVSFAFNGFLPPVDGNKTLNAMKAGSTAPIKWQIPDGSGGYISDLSVVNRTTSGVISCVSGSNLDELEQYATGGTSLRYDTASNQYIYNWQSPKKAGTCYKVVIALTDGSTHEALFNLR
jgi:hypothetical protein